MGWNKVWEDVFQKHEWGKYPSESLIRFVAKNFYSKNRAKIRILEVGCGPGANVWYMAREGFCVCGIDGSSTAIDRAKQRLKKEHLKANLITGDAASLPYLENYFDAVVDNECLAHNSKKDTENILREICRVLKKGGLFYSRTFTSKVYLGHSHKKTGSFEYYDVSDGPFAGRGLVRVINREGIRVLYGKFFQIASIDKHEYTLNNELTKISEWVIVCQNKG